MKAGFSLVPFPQQPAPGIAVTGTVFRQENQLNLTYCLEGASQINLPDLSQKPLRRFGLWQNTCFEFFLGLEKQSQYWEFNIAPSGDWNVFQLSDYRQGLGEEASITVLSHENFRKSNSLQLQVSADLDSLVSPQQSLHLGIAAVIQEPNQNLSYWALNHPASLPDFHHREGWLLRL